MKSEDTYPMYNSRLSEEVISAFAYQGVPLGDQVTLPKRLRSGGRGQIARF
jgi:hypothetical protein